MARLSIDRRHLLFLSKPEFGHIIPLLSLAQRLSVYHDITLVVSKIRLDEAKKGRIISEDHPGLAFYGLEDGITEPSEHDVPFGQVVAHSMQSTGKMQELLQIIPSRKKPNTDHSEIMKPVDAIFCDVLMVDMLTSIFRADGPAFFLIQTAGAEAMLFSLVMGQYTETDISEPWDGKALFFELTSLEGPHRRVPDVLLNGLQVAARSLPSAAALILNCDREAEYQNVLEIEKRAGAKVFCCGPLLPPLPSHIDREKQVKNDAAIQWLNTQETASVIYIGFGSLVTPAPEQLREIARALITLKKPFVWSLKPAFHEYLPSEMLDTECSGRVYKWVPQQEVLMHASIGLVLHHGGWGATQQTLAAGKPALVWPMASDEKMAGKYVMEKGAALMMEGTGVDAERLVLAEEIVEALIKVEMTCKKGSDLWGRKLRASLKGSGASQKELFELANLINEVCSF